MRRALLVNLVIVAGLPGTSQAATLHVDDVVGPSSPDCGSVGDPCTRIVDAIQRARGAGFPGGDRIQLAPGSYHEDVHMTFAADSGNVIAGSGSSTPRRSGCGSMTEHM